MPHQPDKPRKHFSLIRGMHLADLFTLANAGCGVAGVFLAMAYVGSESIAQFFAAAALTPFGGTIAHGFLSLSMLSRMAAEGMLIPDSVKMAVNYGLDRVRFIAPVKSGKRIRGRFRLDSAEEKAPGQLLLRHTVTVEIEG